MFILTGEHQHHQNKKIFHHQILSLQYYNIGMVEYLYRKKTFWYSADVPDLGTIKTRE